MDYFPPLNGDLENPNRPHINANLGAGVQGSIPDAAGYQAMMMSILNVIDGAGLGRDGADPTLLLRAIQSLIAGVTVIPLVEETPVAIGLAAGDAFTLAMTASRTLGNPTGVALLKPFVIYIQQPAGGGCGLSFESNWQFENDEAPANTTTANARDMLIGIGLPDNKVFGHMKLNIL